MRNMSADYSTCLDLGILQVIQRTLLILIYAVFITWILMLNVGRGFLKFVEKDHQIVLLADKYLKTYILLYQLNLGIHTPGISIAISFLTMSILAIVYIRFYSNIYELTWCPITRECLTEWRSYIRLNIAGLFMITLVSWSLECSILLAATISERSLTAQTIAYQTETLFYYISYAFGLSANIRIGQYMGANEPSKAKQVTNLLYIVMILPLLVNMILILSLCNWIPLFFISKTEKDSAATISFTKKLLIVVAFSQIIDGYQGLQLDGMIKACGQQPKGAIIATIGFVLICMPVAVVLIYGAKIDIYGYWIGLFCAECFTNLSLFIIIQRFDWQSYATQITTAAVPSTALISYGTNTRVEISVDKSLFELIKWKLLCLSFFIVLFIISIVFSAFSSIY
ncbi:unnamed protein product [Didymodactylos carnosus]|uniref:Uncharacterized protein n=1 Tax=Didymodactylos carnosus TaxID=1234261 RepID=A0A814YSW5_9BILA|nr:unnamed protein product [Didymodactylos carnosus]CAF3997596.1 unnamed protein product [Didymodactylos carnosus]